MTTPIVSALSSLVLLAVPLMSYADCSNAFIEQVRDAERIVDSLRPEKPAQMRVFAADGSEYSSGQALWMKGQLRGIRRECARGDDAAAASALRGVQEVLGSHREGSTPAA